MSTISINDCHWCYHDPWVMMFWNLLKKKERQERRSYNRYTNGRQNMWPENQEEKEENNCMGRQIHDTQTNSLPSCKGDFANHYSICPASPHLIWSFFIRTRFGNCWQRHLKVRNWVLLCKIKNKGSGLLWASCPGNGPHVRNDYDMWWPYDQVSKLALLSKAVILTSNCLKIKVSMPWDPIRIFGPSG